LPIPANLTALNLPEKILKDFLEATAQLMEADRFCGNNENTPAYCFYSEPRLLIERLLADSGDCLS
jgi:hypothetical protein